MADYLPDDAGKARRGNAFRRLIRTRKLLLGVAALLGVVAACVAVIALMLQKLETRSNAYQPPMTELERQRLLPADPVLDAAPRLDGLRYGDQGAPQAAEPPVEALAAPGAPGHGTTRVIEDLHATAHQDAKSASSRR
ncbi:hypothetical protein ACI2KS_25155 [Pseudomonas sp. NPDC087358]|uniref:hypothetical protein n=1 Tax=Pseudomonas sp. NPDC087358 TaxID=3364439 RepID=UPI00384C885B